MNSPSRTLDTHRQYPSPLAWLRAASSKDTLSCGNESSALADVSDPSRSISLEDLVEKDKALVALIGANCGGLAFAFSSLAYTANRYVAGLWLAADMYWLNDVARSSSIVSADGEDEMSQTVAT